MALILCGISHISHAPIFGKKKSQKNEMRLWECGRWDDRYSSEVGIIG